MTDEHSQLIEDACQSLSRGELLIIPTETVYGLAADARNDDAIRRVFQLKGRPLSKPLIVHLASANDLNQWAHDVPDYAHALADAFWPGPLTLVLKKKSTVSALITGGQDTVALRVPDHPLTRALLCHWGGAVVAPSANRYGRLSPTTAEAATEAFGDQAPMVVDGGACRVGIESTMLLCVGPQPVLLRPGCILNEDIERVTGLGLVTNVDSNIEAPGRDTSHYAPNTPCYQWDREMHPDWRPETTDIAFVGFSVPPFEVSHFVQMPVEPNAAAQMLYHTLRQLDQEGHAQLLIERVPDASAWSGIADRLQRASISSVLPSV